MVQKESWRKMRDFLIFKWYKEPSSVIICGNVNILTYVDQTLDMLWMGFIYGTIICNKLGGSKIHFYSLSKFLYFPLCFACKKRIV